ncbi:ATP-binding protein [Kiloniella majae]|uniref:hybrid sensor histidine kinase/response regulator n=1 Tax=Kiloniella majae TaxID=1938558 RepID=UPI000A278EB4|nr:ATP-binding protein [Kiloniella majae]
MKEGDGVKSIFEMELQMGSQMGTGFATFDNAGHLLSINDSFLALDDEAQRSLKGSKVEKFILEKALASFVPTSEINDLIDKWGSDHGSFVRKNFTGEAFLLSHYKTAEGGTCYLKVPCNEQTNPQTLPSSEVLLDAIQSLDIGIALYDADLCFVLSNKKYIDLVMPDSDALRPGRNIRDITKDFASFKGFTLPPDLSLEEWIDKVVLSITSYEKDLEIPRPDGRLFLGSTHKTGGGGYLVTIKDITKQREMENASREADMLLHKIVEACPANFLVSRVSDGKIIYCPPASRDRFGDIETAKSFFIKPQDREDYLKALLPSGTLDDYRVQFRRRDGSIMQGLTSARVTDYKGEDVIVSSTRDITEQLQMQKELEEQREIAHQNEKISALGGLLAGVAHELNNPLSIVVGYALMLQDKTDDPEVKRRVDRIAMAAERCAKIVKTFLAMARQRPMQIENCNLNEAVEVALDVAGYGLKVSGAEISLSLAKDLPFVAADHDQMAQVFTNLIVNAEHALSEKGEESKLVIRSSFDDLLGEVVVDVIDNGIGIPKEIQARIFEPFFTTKDVGSGTGVGLAFCHRIVDAHNGNLSFRSSAKGGTCFSVRMKASEVVEENKIAPDLHDEKHLKQSVLVVDDEIDVADLIHEILTEDGYDVTAINSAKDALSELKSHSYDAILSDVKMPGIDGIEFLKRITAEFPEMAAKTAFVTGDSMSPEVADFIENSGCLHLEKPVSPDELVNMMRSLIQKTGK